MKNSKIVAIIPARGNSKSIPKKNLLYLGGKPLVAWPIQLAKSIGCIDRVIVSTQDETVARIARKFGAETPFKRPVSLCQDDTPTKSVLYHAVKYLERKENYKIDIIALLYPTSPMLNKKRVIEGLNLLANSKINSVVSVYLDFGHYWRKTNQTYSRFYPLNLVNRQYYNPLYRENGAIYFSRYNVIMKLRKLVDDDNVKLLIMDKQENVDIDDYKDYLLVKKIIAKK